MNTFGRILRGLCRCSRKRMPSVLERKSWRIFQRNLFFHILQLRIYFSVVLGSIRNLSFSSRCRKDEWKMKSSSSHSRNVFNSIIPSESVQWVRNSIHFTHSTLDFELDFGLFPCLYKCVKQTQLNFPFSPPSNYSMIPSRVTQRYIAEKRLNKDWTKKLRQNVRVLFSFLSAIFFLFFLYFCIPAALS